MDPFSEVFEGLDRELWIVTARNGKHSSGLVATYVTRVSLVPDLPRVTIALAKHHYTHDLIEASGAFCLHLIDESQIDWVWRFGISTGRNVDKLQGLAIAASAGGAPVLADAQAWVDCRVESRLDTGDRTIYLGEVLGAGCRMQDPGRQILTLKRLLQSAPANSLRELKAAMEHDINLDRAAILDWRRKRESPR